MSFVTLVRHGQANTGARDETSYDRLSELGWQQARWLGDHFLQTKEVFSRVYCGTLRRHQETTQGIAPEGHDAPVQDERLNEMHYFDLATAFHEQHDEPVPDGREDFIRHLPRLFSAWRDGRLEGIPESFETFETRVGDVISEIAAGQGRALVVTSGGFIGMAMRQVLDLDMTRLAQTCLAVENTSMHRIQPMDGKLAMTQFNATPHLDTPERQHARSHI